MTDTIYLYGESSNLAGMRCRRNPEDRDDVTQHEVTINEFKRLRRAARTAGAGRDMYLRRCAREVMKALR